MTPTQIIAVVAYQPDRGIGKANTLPWHVPSDLQHFKTLTQSGIVAMGRNTWESLPIKPLPNRLNVVISSRALNETSPQLLRVRDLDEALACTHQYHKPLYLIGGARTYETYLSRCTDIIATEFSENLVQGADCFFPQIDPARWEKVSGTTYQHPNEPRYVIKHYRRRKM